MKWPILTKVGILHSSSFKPKWSLLSAYLPGWKLRSSQPVKSVLKTKLFEYSFTPSLPLLNKYYLLSLIRNSFRNLRRPLTIILKSTNLIGKKIRMKTPFTTTNNCKLMSLKMIILNMRLDFLRAVQVKNSTNLANCFLRQPSRMYCKLFLKL